MSDKEVREYRLPTQDGKFVTVRMREKCRCVKDGVEGILFDMLHPDTLFEVGEYWAPVSSNPGLSALSNEKE
jgi:hypothetical protein